MTTILSTSKMLDQEQQTVTTLSETSCNQARRKFSGRPLAIVRTIGSVVQTSTVDHSAVSPCLESVDTQTRSYYLSPRLAGSEEIFLPPQPYELRAASAQFEEGNSSSGDIAVHKMTQALASRSVGIVQLPSNSSFGRFLASPSSSSIGLPRLRPKSQETDIDVSSKLDEESYWRGVFALPSSDEIFSSRTVEIKVDELPSWEPHISIDSYRFEDDDE